MSSFDIPINLNRLRRYHPHADALAQLQENKGDNLSSYNFTVLTKHSTKEETEKIIDELISLLTQYGFEEEYFAVDLLFFSTFIYEDITRLEAQYKGLTVAKATLKSLLDIMRINRDNKSDDIKIEVKGNIGDKAIVTGSSFVNILLPTIIESLRTAIYSTAYNPHLAKLVEDVQPNYNELSTIYDQLKLTKKRPYSQAISYNANLILNYLEHESHLTKGDAKLISDKQCQFIYDYLSLFEFLDGDYIDSLPKDYIRSMIENFDLSSL